MTRSLNSFSHFWPNTPLEGLALGGVIGVALGIAVGLSQWFEATVDPPMQMVRALPHLGLIPLFILWFGIGELPKVLLVALGVSFPLYLNTFSAIKQVDPKLLEILVCPATHGPLEYDAAAGELISHKAGLAYPIRDGIPIMLVSEARHLKDGA